MKISTLVGVLALSATASFVHGQSCPPSPAGIVGWWTGDGSTKDVAYGNDATNDGATYAPGVVNEAFQFDGSTSAIVIGNPAVLQLQTFSIVMWMARADAAVAGNANLPSPNTGELFCYGSGGYCLGLEGNGTLFLSKVGTSLVESTGAKITDTTPHQVAVTADAVSGDVIFYVDSVASPTATYSPTYTFTTNVAIGVVGDLQPPGAAGNFFGDIDEIQVYDDALNASQILSIFNAGNLGTCRIIPHPLAVDVNAVTGSSSNVNGVFEAGETVQISPEWMNEFPSTQGITGTASSLTGPAGPTYTIDDDKASYGAIPSGGQHDCNGATVNCYLVTISGTRPSEHWDATFKEVLAGTNPPRPFANNWPLHVGESFPDVPTSHQFYAFIENLFHNGVTGGCGGGIFCPGDPVTRGQMAVFLLKGEHGGTYAPPACSSTMFADVPCPGAQFVDWINQLATEGITGGCGNGNYCPDSSVTRGQMAVFLLKGEHGGAYTPPACSATMFADVECPDAQFVDWINQLATEGITGGCGNGNYCPQDSVTRGQMAVFLVKTFGLVLYGS
jgi:hypothetical protein